MATESQIRANQANAQKSTGPTSQEGKETSAQNNFKHGLSSHLTFGILLDEDKAAYQALEAGLTQEHQPQTISEEILVTRMAQHEWLRCRAQRLQIKFFEHPQDLSLFMRYEAMHDRGFLNCLAALQKLRAERRKEQIGFESQSRSRETHEMKKERHQQAVALSNARLAKQNPTPEVKKAPTNEPLSRAAAA